MISVQTNIMFLVCLSKSKDENPTKATNKPNTTFALKALNTVLRPFHTLKIGKKFQPLDLEDLKKEAMEKTKLTNFGPHWDEIPYLETINIVNQTNYSPVGKFLMYNYFLQQLKELLLIEETFSNDESLQEYCKGDSNHRPLVVLGLPRTGTTFLHSLLALDPNVRAPLKWELDYPSPRDVNDAEKDKEIRIKLAESDNLNAAKTFAPHILQLHDNSDVTRPEECECKCYYIV